MKHSDMIIRSLCTFFGLAALTFSQERPLDNSASRQYQHEIRPLRLALDRWLHELGFQEAGLSIRLVKASDLPPNSCGMSTYDLRSVVGEIDVLWRANSNLSKSSPARMAATGWCITSSASPERKRARWATASIWSEQFFGKGQEGDVLPHEAGR